MSMEKRFAVILPHTGGKDGCVYFVFKGGENPHFDFVDTIPTQTTERNLQQTFKGSKVVETDTSQWVVVTPHDGNKIINLLTTDGGNISWTPHKVPKPVASAMLHLAAKYKFSDKEPYPPFNPENVKPVIEYLKKNEKALFNELGLEYPFKEVKTAAKVCEAFMKEFMEQYNKDQIMAGASHDDEAGAGPVAVAQFVSVDPQVDDDCTVIGVSSTAQGERREARRKRNIVDLTEEP